MVKIASPSLQWGRKGKLSPVSIKDPRKGSPNEQPLQVPFQHSNFPHSNCVISIKSNSSARSCPRIRCLVLIRAPKEQAQLLQISIQRMHITGSPNIKQGLKNSGDAHSHNNPFGVCRCKTMRTAATSGKKILLWERQPQQPGHQDTEPLVLARLQSHKEKALSNVRG